MSYSNIETLILNLNTMGIRSLMLARVDVSETSFIGLLSSGYSISIVAKDIIITW